MPESQEERNQISRRKSEHLRIVLEEPVLHQRGTLLDEIQLMHEALPELNLDQIDTSVELFGKTLRTPLMITSMTGGAEATRQMNRELAAAAASHGAAFSVGSQRVMLRRPEVASDFQIRRQIPDGVLLGNIGGVQLPQIPLDDVVRLVQAIDADGICVHLNPAQELCQPEGDRDFTGVLDGIGRLVERLEGKVLVKETGAGLSPTTLRRLFALGVGAIDVAGQGGTSWTRVEMHRAPEGPVRELGHELGDWGIPTAFGVVAARQICGDGVRVVGSGGVCSGLDVARVIAAGADVAGFARAALVAWTEGGQQGVERMLRHLTEVLRSVMLLTGSPDVRALQNAPRIYTGALHQWLAGAGLLI